MDTNILREGTRRLFFSPPEPQALLQQLSSAGGGFIPTRLAFHLGEQALLALEVPQACGALEIPIVVVGRRAPRGSTGYLLPGIVARLADPADPRVAKLRDALSGAASAPHLGVGRKERLFFTRYLRRSR